VHPYTYSEFLKPSLVQPNQLKIHHKQCKFQINNSDSKNKVQWMTTVVLTVIFKNSKLFRKQFVVLKFLNFQTPLNLLMKICNGHIFFEKNYIFEVSIWKNNQFRRIRTVVALWNKVN